jgi:glycosyltransferase involved in cell wall biosynthesis
MNNLAIILTVYKRDKLEFLRMAVKSMLEQTYTDFDLIIALDGPVEPDIRKYLSKIESKRIILLKYTNNEGLPATLNKVIKYCEKQGYIYIGRMDADDLSHPERIEKQIRMLEQGNDLIAVGTEAFIINGDNQIIGEKKVASKLTYKKLRLQSDIVHASVIFKIDFFKNIGYYNPTYHQSQDYDLWFRAVAIGMKIISIHKKLYYMRFDDRIIDRRKRAQRYALKIKSKYLRPKDYIFLFPNIMIVILPKFILNIILNKRISWRRK